MFPRPKQSSSLSVSSSNSKKCKKKEFLGTSAARSGSRSVRKAAQSSPLPPSDHASWRVVNSAFSFFICIPSAAITSSSSSPSTILLLPFVSRLELCSLASAALSSSCTCCTPFAWLHAVSGLWPFPIRIFSTM
jgi:hypothetical protein